MGDEEAVELLERQLQNADEEDGGWAALVGLDLVEGELDLPPLVVGGREVGRGHVLVVQDAGHDGEDLAPLATAGDVVVDDADVHAGQLGELHGAGGEPLPVSRAAS